MIFSFIKMTNNQNPLDFHIEITSQKRWLNRVNHLRHMAYLYYYDNIGSFKPVYEMFTKDLSCFRVHIQEFDNLRSAREHIPLIRYEYEKRLTSASRVCSSVSPPLDEPVGSSPEPTLEPPS